MAIDPLFVLYMVLVGLSLVTMLLPINICVKSVALVAIIFEVPMILFFGIPLVLMSREAEDWKEKVFDLAPLATLITILLFITKWRWVEP
jgi:hypothetical protein